MATDLAPRKIFAGPRLKRLRRERRLTQARMADELDVSPSYLNLMESNQRPITVQVLIRLADVYGIDPRDFMEIEGEQSVGDMEQILADPLFRDAAVPRAEVRDAAEHSPALLSAMLRLYRAYSTAREASEAGAFSGGDRDRAEPLLAESPIEKVRGHPAGRAQSFRRSRRGGGSRSPRPCRRMRKACSRPSSNICARAMGIRVRALPLEVMGDRLRWYDHHRKQLMISEVMDQPGRTFQAAYQLALTEFSGLLNETVTRLEGNDEVARKLLRVTLANYFAGALMMPYGRFQEAAELVGYDVELLSARFGASFEQVAHRLTTLSRQNARGVPFFLLRVDIAGNVSKRFSSGRFPFANSGGTCPVWNIHATFTNPGRILTQVIELTDGTQWFSIARTVRRSITPWGAIEPRFAIGLGCEIKYARRLVYAKGLDFDNLEATPIGINCRLCDRQACPQRAAPPALRALLVDESTRNVSPFPFKDV